MDIFQYLIDYHLSIKEWILDLFGIWYTILLIILYFCFKDFYDNTFDFLLNYLNIIDLLNNYIEVGYSLGNITLLYKKAFSQKENYKYFLLGKLSFYEKKKLEKFKKHYQDLVQKYNLYIKNNSQFQKFEKIKNFIEKKYDEKYFKKEEELGIELEKPEAINENMTEKELENLISEPYEKCKSYCRKLDRINNLRNDALNRKDSTKNETCIAKLMNKCTSCHCCQKCCYIYYAIICIIIILLEIFGNMTIIEILLQNLKKIKKKFHLIIKKYLTCL